MLFPAKTCDFMFSLPMRVWCADARHVPEEVARALVPISLRNGVLSHVSPQSAILTHSVTFGVTLLCYDCCGRWEPYPARFPLIYVTFSVCLPMRVLCQDARAWAEPSMGRASCVKSRGI